MARAKDEVTLDIGGHEVVITSPTRLLVPAAGVTKLDLVNYYLAVADGALRGAGGRPCILVRYPNGIEDEFFFQKRAPARRPDWLEVAEIRFPSGRSAEGWNGGRRDSPARSGGRVGHPRQVRAMPRHHFQEERRGVFVDYNQSAKDRTVTSACSVRPKPDARVSAPVSWKELGECDPADFTLWTARHLRPSASRSR